MAFNFIFEMASGILDLRSTFDQFIGHHTKQNDRTIFVKKSIKAIPIFQNLLRGIRQLIIKIHF